jgi:hypothetical protein
MFDETYPLRVLLIGASGVFGSRLAELAAREQAVHLTLAGRDGAALEALAARIGGPAIMVLNRDRITALDLINYDLIVDAAGPFQASHTRVVEAAIAARKHYIDLADGREFVGTIGRYDEDARAGGVAVISGASSIPALSHAAIDGLVAGWQAIDALRIGIFPGNRAPRGLSVVEAILSYVGRPVRVFIDGNWREVPGWGMLHREHIPGVGVRWASVCDTPEQDLLVARYRPRRSAEFFAGMELSLLHLGLAALAWPVRWGLLESLRPWASPLLWLARRFERFGCDVGAMTVTAEGIDAAGRPVGTRWVLKATGNRGPYIPVLAALALIRRFRQNRPPEPGARACSGMLSMADFEADFVALGIETAEFRDSPDIQKTTDKAERSLSGEFRTASQAKL